jgi:hypothetical protein
MSQLSPGSLVLAFGGLFIPSTVILLIASTATIPLPAWGGYLDVGIVLLIALTGFAIYQRSKGVPRYDASYQSALYPLPILLPGAAWRTYFFLSLLPHSLRIWKLEGGL